MSSIRGNTAGTDYVLSIELTYAYPTQIPPLEYLLLSRRYLIVPQFTSCSRFHRLRDLAAWMIKLCSTTISRPEIRDQVIGHCKIIGGEFRCWFECQGAVKWRFSVRVHHTCGPRTDLLFGNGGSQTEDLSAEAVYATEARCSFH